MIRICSRSGEVGDTPIEYAVYMRYMHVNSVVVHIAPILY